MGPLAILVDAAAGIVNHYRRRPGQWTVSSELSMDLSPDIGDLDGPVLASAHAFGPAGCLVAGDVHADVSRKVIGAGTVRSFFIAPVTTSSQYRSETLRRSPETTFVRPDGGRTSRHGAAAVVLAQRVDHNLNNDIDIVHGGVAAAGLELAASAAINRGRSDGLLQTASVRVNFLRPFFAGTESRYDGTPTAGGPQYRSRRCAGHRRRRQGRAHRAGDRLPLAALAKASPEDLAAGGLGTTSLSLPDGGRRAVIRLRQY